MTPTALCFLAQQAPVTVASPWTPSNILVGFVGLAVTLTVFSSVVLLLVRGFWDRSVEPLIKTAIVTWMTSEAQILARRREIEAILTDWYSRKEQASARKEDVLASVRAWHNEPEEILIREAFVNKVIDNQVRRDDGLIHTEINTRVKNGVEPLHADMKEIKRLLTNKANDEHAFREDVMSRLGHLMGLLEGNKPRPLPPRTPVRSMGVKPGSSEPPEGGSEG